MNGMISQFKQLVKEHGQMKKKLKTMEQSFSHMERSFKHAKDIAKARGQKKLISQEELFNKLGI